MEIDRPKIKALAITKIPLFQALSEQERQTLAERLVLKDFKKGSSIMLSQQAGREMMFVADGTVDIKRSSPDGKEVIISRLGVGDFFGEISLLTGSSRSADVVAVEDCMVLILSAEDFDYLSKQNSGFTRALLVDLARRVAAASTRISDLALLDVYLRVLSSLTAMAKPSAKRGDLIVDPRPTHRDLAAMVGSSREMVTRALSRLEEEGHIRVDGEQVHILSAG